jgi:hypothetical protein
MASARLSACTGMQCTKAPIAILEIAPSHPTLRNATKNLCLTHLLENGCLCVPPFSHANAYISPICVLPTPKGPPDPFLHSCCAFTIKPGEHGESSVNYSFSDILKQQGCNPKPVRLYAPDNLQREASWRSGDAEDCKSLYGGSIPSEASKIVRSGPASPPAPETEVSKTAQALRMSADESA